MIDDVMTDRLLYEREHRMNSTLINDNSMLRAVHQDDRAKIARYERALQYCAKFEGPISIPARSALEDMTTERDALVRVKIALVDKVEMLENLVASMVIECDANMPAKAAWLARRNGFADSGRAEHE